MQKTIHKKIVRLNQAPNASKVIERILKKLERGDILELAVVARERVPKERQEELDCKTLVNKYWFGQSGVSVIGLLEYMKNEVYEFIKGYIDEYDVDDIIL